MTTPKIRVRMNPLARKEKILKAAIDIAIEKGYESITRTNVALKAQCATGLINHYFRNIDNLRAQVIETAIHQEIIPIIADNLQKTGKLSNKLKNKIINYIST